MKITKFIFISLLYSFYTKNAYDNLLEWGKNNSLYISDKIGMKYITENNKSYYAIEDIEKETLLMKIPYKILLNVKNALKFLNNKKFTKLYEGFKTYFMTTADQTFLTYLVYLVNHRPKHYKNNKFYQYYQYLFDTFETNLDSYPLFYNPNQFLLLEGSLASFEVTLINEVIKDEIYTFENQFKQKTIDFEEYAKLRTLIITKSINISEVSLVPFLDLFKTDPIDFNVIFGFNDTEKSVDIFTNKKIRKGDILYITSGNYSNSKRFVLFGETFEKMKDYVDTFSIPMLTYPMKKSINIKEIGDYEDTIDLSQKQFYKKALKTYKKVAKLKNGNDSNLSAYKVFLDNLEIFQRGYANITTSDIHKQFIKVKDINNVKRVLDFEKKYLNQRIQILKKHINKLETNNKNNKKTQKTDEL